MKIILIILLTYSILTTWALVRIAQVGSDHGNPAAALMVQAYTHDSARKIASIAFGPHWRDLSVDQALNAWNKAHPTCYIATNESLNHAGHDVLDEVMRDAL